MATSTRERALQVWKTHGENKPRDPGAVVIHGPGPKAKLAAYYHGIVKAGEQG